MKRNKIKLTKEIVIAIIFIIIIFSTMISILIPTIQDISKSVQKYVKDNPSISDKLNVKKVKKEAKNIKNIVEKNSDEKLYGRIKYIEIYGKVNKIIDNYVIDGEYVTIRLNNGYLTENRDKIIKQENIIKNNSSFNNYLKQRNIDFLYVQAPAKVNKYDQQLPIGIKNYGNLNADKLLEGLSNSGIDTFDLREKMKEELDDYYSAFFKTDHHWKPETGLWAAKQIAKELNQKYNFNFDIQKFDISNYNIKVYEKSFLGSEGRRVSLGYVEPEDISLITPNWDTDITIQIPKIKLNKTGRFEDVLIDHKKLEKIDYYNNDMYAAYLYGNVPRTVIKNNLNHSGKKILMLNESFSLAMVPFLVDGASEIHLIDLRYYKDSVKEYVKKNQIGIVIMMLNANFDGQIIS